MGIYIKDMKMPKTCEECRYFIKTRNLIDLDYKYHCINGASALVFPSVYEYRAFDCPLIDVPEPHGRLIDERVAYDKIAEQETGYYMDMDGVDKGLQDTPTVIEGSE